MANVNHEQHVRQTAHIANPGERAGELVAFTTEDDDLFLHQLLERAVFGHAFNRFEAVDGLADGLEVGHHPAEPAEIDIRHPAAGSRFADRFRSAALGADEHHAAAVGDNRADKIQRVVQHRHRLFEVDNVDVAPLAINIRRHLGIPETGTVPEVCACLKQLAHTDFTHSIYSIKG